MLRRGLLVVAVLAIALPAVPSAAVAEEAWEVTLDLAFPSLATATFSDTYDACRSGCARTHQATDVIGEKHWPLYAVVDGVVCRLDEGDEDSYGRHLTICGDDGNSYRYLHLNNDTPGTDDGAAALEHVYAPGIRRGARVARGQHVAYMGDSGNAENTVSHLHFDIFVPGVVNPWGEERINPYPSLRAAADRGEFPDGTAAYLEASDRIAGSDRVATAIALSERTYESAAEVVLATGDVPQYALVAGPLAAALDAPVLISRGGLDERVLAEITRLGAVHLTVVGPLADDLTPLTDLVGAEAVEVVDGGDAFATSALVAERVYALQGAAGDAVTEVIATPLDLDLSQPAPPEAEPALALSLSPERTDPLALDGAILPADLDAIYVALGGVDPTGVVAVAFFIDDPELVGDPYEVQRSWPWDLAGSGWQNQARAFDPRQLDEGGHTLTAAIAYEDSTVVTLTAAFTRAPGVVPRRALVALGSHEEPSRAWPDALVGSWYGAVRGMPVLLTTTDVTPPEVETVMATLAEVVLSGGTAAISTEQADHLAEVSGTTVERLSGRDRYATAVAIADDLVRRDLVAVDEVYLATGRNWPDAVTSAAAVARGGKLLLLVDGTGGASAVSEEAIVAVADVITMVHVLGGDAAVSEDVARVMAMLAV